MKLQADSINGVYKVEEFNGIVLTDEEFYEALNANPDELVICTEVNDAMAKKIEAEYGIRDEA